jgi:hypothetical protein
MRTILLSSYHELDKDDSHAVPIDLLEKYAVERNFSAEDFACELKAAIHEGDLALVALGMIGPTEVGKRHYDASLKL